MKIQQILSKEMHFKIMSVKCRPLCTGVDMFNLNIIILSHSGSSFPTMIACCGIESDLQASMMTSSNGNIFRVTGHLCGEFTGQRWIPRSKASGALMFSLICVWINDWVNNREAGDLRRYRAHYDVIVMIEVTQYSIWLVLVTYTV